MEPQVDHVRVEGAGAVCAGCGQRIPPGAPALGLSRLPTILQGTFGAYRFDRIECARARVREEYRELVTLRSTNPSGWNAHATTNQERMLTLKSLAERLERPG